MSGSNAPPDFRTIFDSHRNFVYHICFRYLRDSGDAEDLSQDVFLKIHRYLPDYRGSSALTSWIYRIAANCCIDALRARKPVVRLEESEIDEMVVSNLGRHEDASLARIDLGRILVQTDSRTREILFLSLAEGCSHEEVGEVVGLSKWAVTKIVNRFQKKLQAGKKAWYAELFKSKSVPRGNSFPMNVKVPNREAA